MADLSQYDKERLRENPSYFAECNPESFKDRNVLRVLYIEENMTYSEIGDLYCTHKNTINYWGKKFNLDKNKSEYSNGPSVSRDTLYNMYYKDGLSQSKIAEEFNVSQSAVHKWMNEYGIETRGPAGLPKPPIPEEDFRELYIEDGLGLSPISDIADTTENTLRRWRDTWDIDPHQTGNKKLDENSIDNIVQMYESGMTQKEISEKLSVNIEQTSVSRVLRQRNIETRNEAGFGSMQQTERGEEVKSRLERDVADWLYKNDIQYEYEPTLRNTSYIPDFLVYDDVIIEVWGIIQSTEYDSRRISKTQVYTSLGYEVVSVFPDDNISDSLSRVTEYRFREV